MRGGVRTEHGQDALSGRRFGRRRAVYDRQGAREGECLADRLTQFLQLPQNARRHEQLAPGAQILVQVRWHLFLARERRVQVAAVGENLCRRKVTAAAPGSPLAARPPTLYGGRTPKWTL